MKLRNSSFTERSMVVSQTGRREREEGVPRSRGCWGKKETRRKGADVLDVFKEVWLPFGLVSWTWDMSNERYELRYRYDQGKNGKYMVKYKWSCVCVCAFSGTCALCVHVFRLCYHRLEGSVTSQAGCYICSQLPSLNRERGHNIPSYTHMGHGTHTHKAHKL